MRDLVRVHQVLLNILIGKAGLFTNVPIIGQPVAAVLRSYEGVIDSFLFQLVEIAGAESKTIDAQQKSLEGTIATAISVHSGQPTVQ